MNRRRFAALLLTTSLAAGLLAGGVASAPPAGAYPNPSVELVGHGFGHGRGLGQYGALGYAIDKNWGYKQILGHYYGGTTEGGLPGGDGFGITVRLMDRNGGDTVVTGPLSVDEDPTAGVQSAVIVHRTGPDTWTAQYNSAGSCTGPWGPARAVAGGSVTIRPQGARC